jgi:hypothetical protein
MNSSFRLSNEEAILIREETEGIDHLARPGYHHAFLRRRTIQIP